MYDKGDIMNVDVDKSLYEDDFMNRYEGDETGFDPIEIKEAKPKAGKGKRGKAKAEGQLTFDDLIPTS